MGFRRRSGAGPCEDGFHSVFNLIGGGAPGLSAPRRFWPFVRRRPAEQRGSGFSERLIAAAGPSMRGVLPSS
jgi:hypothetical protein